MTDFARSFVGTGDASVGKEIRRDVDDLIVAYARRIRFNRPPGHNWAGNGVTPGLSPRKGTTTPNRPREPKSTNHHHQT